MDDCATIWIVSPMLNDAASFRELHALAQAAVKQSRLAERYALRFAVVDDSAGLDREAKDLGTLEQVEVLTPPFNLGHQRAIVFGLRSVLERLGPDDLVVTMDSDGQDRPEDVPRLVSAIEERGSDAYSVVLARRTRRRESLWFKFLYFNFKLMFRALTGTLIRSGNFVCMRAAFVQQLINHPYFNLCYSSTFRSLRVPLIEVPCERDKRLAGDSRMNTLRLIGHGFSMLMPFVDVIATRMLVVFSLLFGSTILFAVVLGVLTLLAGFSVPAWAVYALLALLTISFMSMSNFVILFALFSQAKGFSLGAVGPAKQ